MPFLNFTTALGTSNAVYYNTSYIIADQPPGMTTPTVWLTFTILGLALLLLSRQSQEPTLKDLAGILAVPIILISAIQSFAVDVITGTVYTTGTSIPYLGAIVQTHTIYHYDLVGFVLGIIFLISIANLYLLWIEYTRLEPPEQEPISDMDMRGSERNDSRSGREYDKED